MSAKDFNSFQNYMKEFISGENYNNKFRLVTSKKKTAFTLIFKNTALNIKDQTFYLNDSTPLKSADVLRLKQLSQNVVDGRGDFFAKGKLGVDFDITFKGEKLEYKNRKLYYKDKV